MYRLLIVDDEIDNVYWLEEMFQYDLKEELEVHTAVSGKEALELLNRIRFDVVLTDIKMPGMTGMELYDRIRENWPACKVIFLTAYPQFEDIYRVSQDKDVKYIPEKRRREGYQSHGGGGFRRAPPDDTPERRAPSGPVDEVLRGKGEFPGTAGKPEKERRASKEMGERGKLFSGSYEAYALHPDPAGA
ncbi:MAG: response regulator transcription factor [Lachnospiraceae bacterium]